MDTIENNNEEVIEQEVETTETENDESTVTDQPVQRSTEDPEAKKARLERQLKQLGKNHPELFREETTRPSKKSDGLDYGQKAFLVANGVKGEAETKLVQNVMRETGKSLEQVLESKYFQAELKDIRDLQQSANATPTGRRSGNMASDSVEYWLTKDFKDVPADMKAKVVNARLQKKENKGVFYNS